MPAAARSGAAAGTDHVAGARASSSGIGTSAARSTTAIPSRATVGAASQAQRIADIAIQPRRGTSATASAATPAASAGWKVLGGASVCSTA